jgi:hypothetical protein
MKIALYQHTFELPENATLAELATAAGAALKVPAGDPVVVSDDVGYYILYTGGISNVGAHKDGDPRALAPTIGERHPGATEIKIQACAEERCQHGSPGIPGYGYLCGWC